MRLDDLAAAVSAVVVVVAVLLLIPAMAFSKSRVRFWDSVWPGGRFL
jgi:hypothetical protein